MCQLSIFTTEKGWRDREKNGTRLVFKGDVDGPINSDIEMARNKNGKHFGNGISNASNKKAKAINKIWLPKMKYSRHKERTRLCEKRKTTKLNPIWTNIEFVSGFYLILSDCTFIDLIHKTSKTRNVSSRKFWETLLLLIF